jgi:hypothetical protein
LDRQLLPLQFLDKGAIPMAPPFKAFRAMPILVGEAGEVVVDIRLAEQGGTELLEAEVDTALTPTIAEAMAALGLVVVEPEMERAQAAAAEV